MLVICVSSAVHNTRQRKALRRSWCNVQTANAATSPLDKGQQLSIQLLFVVSKGSSELQAEQDVHSDMLLVDAAEGYEHLWRKALTSLQVLEQQYDYSYYMHADDDSYLRLDMIVKLLADAPRQRFYWGYIWDGTGNRHTAPIRNPRNKSHMPKEQYALDYYPPFASGCGFILSRDLVQALLKQPLPDYHLLDPPFGIHLCGQDFCVMPEGPVVPVHDERVRPYRGIPIFKPDTIVQHYLAPEEMAPFHAQVLESMSESPDNSNAQRLLDASQPAPICSGHQDSQIQPSAADELYQQLVQLGLLRR